MNFMPMDQPPERPEPPDLDQCESLEECAHVAWTWAYQVVQQTAQDEVNLTREEHRQSHRLTIQLLLKYLWDSVGITPTDEREEEFLDAIHVGWLRYAWDNVVELIQILERRGIIDPIDPIYKSATRGIPYRREEDLRAAAASEDAENDDDYEDEEHDYDYDEDPKDGAGL